MWLVCMVASFPGNEAREGRSGNKMWLVSKRERRGLGTICGWGSGVAIEKGTDTVFK